MLGAQFADQRIIVWRDDPAHRVKLFPKWLAADMVQKDRIVRNRNWNPHRPEIVLP